MSTALCRMDAQNPGGSHHLPTVQQLKHGGHHQGAVGQFVARRLPRGEAQSFGLYPCLPIRSSTVPCAGTCTE